jgi:hypothetical protein
MVLREGDIRVLHFFESWIMAVVFVACVPCFGARRVFLP